MRALRRDPRSSDAFPQDVLELQGYLGEQTLIPGVDAVPGKGSHVPLYILGSSLFGAKLAAALGLPYAFASHFAPADLLAAVAAYRDEFQPSEQLDSAIRDRRGERDRSRDDRRRPRATPGHAADPRHQPFRAASRACPLEELTDEQADRAAGRRRIGPGGPHADLHRSRHSTQKWGTISTSSSGSPVPTS